VTGVGYGQRTGGFASDGTPTFASERDRESERTVAAALEVAWSCEVQPFGALSPIDWFATRHGRVVSVLELKTRTHESGKFATVFLNVRKWLALLLASAGLGVPALFVVRWTDCIGWMRLQDISGAALRVAGCAKRVKAVSDIEPILEISVADFHMLPEAS
jgi:hypothetical protein